MNKILLFLLIIISTPFVYAQNVGIGTSTPNASAMLEINSTSKGLLLPRVADTSSVNTPAKGLVVYNNSNNKLWYYDGVRWQQAVANAGGMDSIWYKTKDTIAYTTRPYVGINTDLDLLTPQANLQVQGAILVQGKLAYSKATPTAAQIYTMNNSSGTQSIANTDSVFRLFDPGGIGNYNNNMQGNVFSSTSGTAGLKISSEASSWGLGTGDTLWISDQFFPACRTDYEYRFTAGSPNPADFIAKFSQRFNFRSNGDGSNAKGFNLLVTRLFRAEPVTKINSAGPALYYNAGNSAFSAGINCDAGRNSVAMGVSSRADQSSIAMGNQTTADGGYSLAIGYRTVASGNYAIAMGGEGYSVNADADVITTATGVHSVAIGSGVTASGPYSLALGEGSAAASFNTVAMGYNTLAEGITSTAMGDETKALGKNSTAMGSYTDAVGEGSVAMGFNTTANGINSTAMGTSTLASGSTSTSMGHFTKAYGFAGTVVGMYNYPIVAASQTVAVATTPLFIVGNGDNSSSLNNALAVLKNGNVGIGTLLPPVTKLQVVGGTDADLTDYSGYLVVGDANSTNLVIDNNEIMARNNGATTTLYVQNDGGAFEIGGTASKPGGGSWSASSDARLKQNVQPYKDGLQQLQKINPVYFNYNQQSGYDTSKQFIGVLAQELKEVAPYMVGTFKKDNTEYLNVDNTAMTYMLINAVKEQQNEIEELKILVKKLISNSGTK